MHPRSLLVLVLLALGSACSAPERAPLDAASADTAEPDAPGLDATSEVDAPTTLDAGEPCLAADHSVLAVRSLAFGEGPSGEWKAYGFDLDGLTSTAVSTDVCQPSSGASPSTPYPDGNDGRDNSFGRTSCRRSSASIRASPPRRTRA